MQATVTTWAGSMTEHEASVAAKTMIERYGSKASDIADTIAVTYAKSGLAEPAGTWHLIAIAVATNQHVSQRARMFKSRFR
jgi:hypothetical protein